MSFAPIHDHCLTLPLDYLCWYGAEGVVQVDEAKFYLGVGIINLFGDVCILTVPISNVIRLRLEKTQKIAIVLIFMLGSFDVFIWSSVEPSIGIISGCLPTLRPLLLHILSSWFNFIPSERSSSGKGSRSISLNPIETIGKKRTRKISKQDTLVASQFTQLNEDAASADALARAAQHSQTWRPDEDEMCLTTTTVHGQSDDSRAGTEQSTSEHAGDSGGIVMTREFEWDEATRTSSTRQQYYP
ncbi:hypothetical protein N0V95_006652 [Ascochyta clinopodiicola]|nr:hypothetical protein N0V95_006652 [Ascochyta clinopodiicola]